MSNYYRTATDHHGRTWVETEPGSFEYDADPSVDKVRYTLPALEDEYGPLNICDGENCAFLYKHKAKAESADDVPMWVMDDEGDYWDLTHDGLYELREGGLICTRERIRSIHGIAKESQFNRNGRLDIFADEPVDPFGPEDAYDHVSDMCERLTIRVRDLEHARDMWRDWGKKKLQRQTEQQERAEKAGSEAHELREQLERSSRARRILAKDRDNQLKQLDAVRDERDRLKRDLDNIIGLAQVAVNPGAQGQPDAPKLRAFRNREIGLTWFEVEADRFVCSVSRKREQAERLFREHGHIEGFGRTLKDLKREIGSDLVEVTDE